MMPIWVGFIIATIIALSIVFLPILIIIVFASHLDAKLDAKYGINHVDRSCDKLVDLCDKLVDYRAKEYLELLNKSDEGLKKDS